MDIYLGTGYSLTDWLTYSLTYSGFLKLFAIKTEYTEWTGLRDYKTKGQKEQRRTVQKNKRTKGQWYKGMRGQRDQDTKGQRGKGTTGLINLEAIRKLLENK